MVTTGTASVDVVTGIITIDPEIDHPDGCLINGTTIEPWGAEEYGMERADIALADIDLIRVGEWSSDNTATVRLA